jgi:hypothetical protein
MDGGCYAVARAVDRAVRLGRDEVPPLCAQQITRNSRNDRGCDEVCSLCVRWIPRNFRSDRGCDEKI